MTNQTGRTRVMSGIYDILAEQTKKQAGLYEQQRSKTSEKRKVASDRDSKRDVPIAALS